ncbi:MAG: NUDIX hydrolase [Candidatus Sungiibacteriota bacterium]|uniref:NUDIX hydrolase n=1 Tax=Candidatus Sungiibacteriota bacterium TaxID=2750080 RepID=A0A7T5RJC4_9BACT|nr:MAG: NUDIX hydrolase [Candidatus Sungbacteria bacterium]
MIKRQFLKKFEKPMMTVDVVFFTIDQNKLKVLLVKRKYDPYGGFWALPGGFIRKNEEMYEAAARELKEETGVRGVYLEQLYTLGALGRDPRGRVVTVAYFALAPRPTKKLKPSYDAAEAGWFLVDKLPRLAFDHKKIIVYALRRVRNKIQYTNAAWSLLPATFSLGEGQKVYESILGHRLDKRNFRKKFLSLGLLQKISKVRRGLRQRPAQLYKFKTKKYVELKRFF